MHDVVPLHGREIKRPRSLAPKRVEPAPSAREPAIDPAPPATPAAAPLEHLTGLDRANARRFRRGRREIEARLDLHGMTQDQAHAALHRFVLSSHAAGRRCVLLITGHGSFGGGVLKQVVPRWLSEPRLRPYLLATAPAQPQHGGHGALYLLLKRTRPENG